MMPDLLAVAVLVATGATLLLLVPFALHRTYLVLVSRGARPERERWSGELPTVTVQLPIFNEAPVVERLIDAAASLEYPSRLLEIQVLDDSNDGSEVRASQRARLWRERGIRVRHVRRGTREGFKAGALAHGLARSEGEFILILDADFVPSPDLIYRLLGPFEDARVGMVQARWDHLNEGDSLLTRCQALLLDAHFFFEQGGRWAAGRFMNFNGTAGMWRRSALAAAGGWSADTLTEDLDVSYRAQMAGWRFVFRPGVGVPAELPSTVRDLELQQKRWAQGGVQTARKVLPALLRGPWSWGIKREAVIHLLGHVAHPLTLLLGLLLVPSAVARRTLGLDALLALDAVIFAAATASFLFFFVAAGRRRGRPWSTLLPSALATLALGIGLTAAVSTAVVRGASARVRDPFHRTPKRGLGPIRYRAPRAPWDMMAKVGLALWMLAWGWVAVALGLWGTLPFVIVFSVAYGWLSVADLWLARPDRIWSTRSSSRRSSMRPLGHPSQDAPLRGGCEPVASH